jgi:integrase
VKIIGFLLFRRALLISLILPVGMACIPVPTLAQNCKLPTPNKEPLATIAGEPIFLSQASPAMSGQLQRLRQAEFELQRKAIEETVSKQLLANEAKKNGLTVEELLQREADSRIGESTTGELQAYTLARPEWQVAYLAMRLALNTTMRACEIRGLRWRDVNLEEAVITVVKSKTESGERTIPLNDDAWVAMLELHDRTEKLLDKAQHRIGMYFPVLKVARNRTRLGQ